MKTESKILLQILRAKKVKRKDLERAIGISPSSMTYMLEKLRNYVEITEEGGASVGKPPQFLSIASRAWRILSVAVGREKVKAVLYNGKGDVLEAFEQRFRRSLMSPTELTSTLSSVLDRFFEYDAVGFAFSGEVDGEKVNSTILRLSEYDVAKSLRLKHRALPFVVVSDVEALAAYESKSSGKDRVLVINYGTGIGACYYEYHSLFTRDEFKNLPLGHLYANSDEPCYCGRRGCLETVASDYVAVRKFKYPELRFVDFISREEAFFDELKLVRNMYMTDPKLYDWLHEESLDHLSVFVGNLALLLGIDELAIYGEGSSEYFAKRLEERICEKFGSSVVKIRYGSVPDAVERGASLLAAVTLVKQKFSKSNAKS